MIISIVILKVSCISQSFNSKFWFIVTGLWLQGGILENMDHFVTQMNNHTVCHIHQTLYFLIWMHNRISTERMLKTLEHGDLLHGALYGLLAVASSLSILKCQGYFADDYKLSWVTLCDSQKNTKWQEKPRSIYKSTVWPCWKLCEFTMKMGNCTIIHSSARVCQGAVSFNSFEVLKRCKIQGYCGAN